MQQFFYQLVFRAVKSFILHAPKFFGGFEGIDLLDVCSSIIGVSSTLLLRSPGICNERLDTYIHGKAVIATTALVVLAIVYSFSAFRFFVKIALRFRKFRYLWGKDKASATKLYNQSAHSTLEAVLLIICSDKLENDQKFATISTALFRHFFIKDKPQ